MAIADFYDAVTSKRVYKDAMSHEETSKLIRDLRGTHFDPEIVDAFFENEAEFNAIRVHNQHDSDTSIKVYELETVARQFIESQASIRYGQAA